MTDRRPRRARPSPPIMTIALPASFLVLVLVSTSVPGDEYWPVGITLGPFLLTIFLGFWVSLGLGVVVMTLIGRAWDLARRPLRPFLLTVLAGGLLALATAALFDITAPRNTGHPVWTAFVGIYYLALLVFSFLPRRRVVG